MLKKFLIATVLAAGLIAFFLIFAKIQKDNSPFKLSKSLDTKGREETHSQKIQILASNLEVPWALAYLPNGELLLTERPGRLKLIKKGQTLTVALINDVNAIGEGGLLGIAAHPDFNKNGFIFVYYTYENQNEKTLNRVVRFKFDGQNLKDQLIVVDAIPGASNHNGGRLKFGPDGYLYITTGDAQNPSLAQDINSLAGKILRVTEDGRAAPGNPFNNLVYSYGHRNPQGLAWDEKGRLFESEHGSSATDELNLIEPGKNYGWPHLRGDQQQSGFVSPLINSGQETWAPSGLAYFKGSLFFAGLRGKALFAAKLNGQVTVKKHLEDQYGRLREVVVGPDNLLYITTSNRDGRGQAAFDDDKIIVVDPKNL